MHDEAKHCSVFVMSNLDRVDFQSPVAFQLLNRQLGLRDMKQKTVYLATLVLFLIVFSCDGDSEAEIDSSLSPIVEATLPESAQVGQKVTFAVRHAVFNGCGYFESQKTTRIGKELYITFFAGYRGGVCTMNIPILTTDYSYTFDVPGVYTFNFNTGEGNYIRQTITVN